MDKTLLFISIYDSYIVRDSLLMMETDRERFIDCWFYPVWTEEAFS